MLDGEAAGAGTEDPVPLVSEVPLVVPMSPSEAFGAAFEPVPVEPDAPVPVVVPDVVPVVPVVPFIVEPVVVFESAVVGSDIDEVPVPVGCVCEVSETVDVSVDD